MRRLILLCSLLFTISVYSQVVDAEGKLRTQKEDTVVGWKKGGVIVLNFAQSSFTNWAAGGQNSISGNGLVSLFANYKKGENTWDNNFDLGYGAMLQGNNLAKEKPIKTDDKVELNSKYGRKASKQWYYAYLLNVKTQMAPGYNYPNTTDKISDLFAPGYILSAIGMDFKPNDGFNLFIAPVTVKITIVNNDALADAGAFGVEPATYDTSGNKLTNGTKVRMELGGYLRMMYKKEIMKNVTFQTKLDLFSNYMNNPGNIDVNWENLISMKVNKYISATINTQLIYDNDIDIGVDKDGDDIIDEVGPRLQFKEIFGVGFSYKF